MSTTRYDVSRAAYREVQGRHEEILKIENTLAELAQIMNDVSVHLCPSVSRLNDVMVDEHFGRPATRNHRQH
jgi:t-SNARE complex subunit (syntaxin)